MGLLPENAKRASRGLRAAFVDGTPPPWPGHRPLVLEGLTEILRDLMHTSDRYSFDLQQILMAATFRYASDQMDDPEIVVPDDLELGRNFRHEQGAQRRHVRMLELLVAPRSVPTDAESGDKGRTKAVEPKPTKGSSRRNGDRQQYPAMPLGSPAAPLDLMAELDMDDVNPEDLC